MNNQLDPSSIERLDSIFQKIVDTDPSHRSEVLAEECGGDHELRDQLTKLIAADEDTDVFP